MYYSLPLKSPMYLFCWPMHDFLDKKINEKQAENHLLTSDDGLFRIFLVGVLMVTNSSAALGWTPIVASNWALVKPALIAIANPWASNQMHIKWIEISRIVTKQYRAAVATKTCIISGASSPHICKPTTWFVFAETSNFIKTRSGSPERVAFSGLKSAV